MKQILLYILTIICILLTSQAQTQDKFHTNEGIPYIPLLDSAPTADSAGSAYLNSTDNIVYWYDGNSWIPGCGLYAPDGTKVVELVSSSGRTWMDRNLGATQAADRITDYNAYGSLFQWCRAADGHQLINWKNDTTGTAVNDTTSTLSTTITPSHSKFIIAPDSPYDWLSTQLSNGNIWWNGSAVGNNNPCPTEYHVPTKTEWEEEIATWSNKNATGAFSTLKLTLAGYIDNSTGTLFYIGSSGIYWSSSIDKTKAPIIGITSTTAGIGSGYRAFGFSIRCIKNEQL